MSLALLFHYLMINMSRMLIHPSSGACDLFVELFHVLYWFDVCWCNGVVGVVWCGVVWYPDAGFSLHPDTTPPQPNHTVTPTHIVPEQYNP
jgi:hypothetical protein